LHLNKILCPSESSLPVCNACQLAKSHQLPYNNSVHQSTSPLEMIFSDVWGPAPQSVGGFKYYISFIDDFSKFCWIYLMHDRSEVPRIFRQFQTHVERLLNTKIKCVQSDWGGEYQKIHNTLFRLLGIAHRVSCPHTHQQNGSAERKHRHIVDTGLALLAHAHVPLKFWDEAFLTATYLINRLPTRVIDNKCPLERLLNTPPNYSMLKIFGCACWPHLRAYNNRKLAFRSKECVFLGYSSLHKGYKCLDIESGRIYISRDVVFDENIFPFARSAASHLAQSHSDCSSTLHKLQSDISSTDVNYDHVHMSLPANIVHAENPATLSLPESQEWLQVATPAPAPALNATTSATRRLDESSSLATSGQPADTGTFTPTEHVPGSSASPQLPSTEVPAGATERELGLYLVPK
jgi:transposase InsO family protein